MSKKSSPVAINISTFLLDLLYPKKCISCGKYGYFLCLDCVREIETVKTSLCPGCGKISENGKYCPRCASNKETIFAKGIIVAAHYDAGPVKEAIYHLKYLGYQDLAVDLSELIYERLKGVFDFKNTVIVPVPLNQKRKNTRGFNQSELIARNLSKSLLLPGGDALKRVRDTRSQVGLRREERLENIRDAFVCDDVEFVSGKKVILVDDVTTTGATINECAKALKSAGAEEIWGVVVARNI